MVWHHCTVYPKVSVWSCCSCFFVFILSAWENRPSGFVSVFGQWVSVGCVLLLRLMGKKEKKRRRFAMLKLPLHPLLLIRFKVLIYFPAFFLNNQTEKWEVLHKFTESCSHLLLLSCLIHPLWIPFSQLVFCNFSCSMSMVSSLQSQFSCFWILSPDLRHLGLWNKFRSVLYDKFYF